MGETDDMMALMGFGGFGGVKPSAKKQEQTAQHDRYKKEAPKEPEEDAGTAGNDESTIGPPRPAPGGGAGERSGEKAGLTSMHDVELPISHELTITHHERTVTAITLDSAGSRFATGSNDYKIKMYDFNGMTTALRSFRDMEPHEGYPIIALSFSPNGEILLSITGSAQPKIFDRDGKNIGEFVRGDMYVRDMTNTKGHVSGCTGGSFHPTDKGLACTSGEDGTVRMWDCWTLKQKGVLKPTQSKPGRLQITACTWNSSGNVISGGVSDGSVQLWDVRGNFGRSAAIGAINAPREQMIEKQDWRFLSGAKQVCKNAHGDLEPITGLAFSRDDQHLLSRCADDTLKVWDVRNLKDPLRSFSGLPTCAQQTNVIFSPRQDLILTGCGTDILGEQGAVHVIDRRTLEPVRRMGFEAGVVCVHWHEQLDQILVGTGDKKHGRCHILYDPSRSTKGALLAATRDPRKQAEFDWTPAPVVQEREPRVRMTLKRKKEMDDLRAIKTRKPDQGLAIAQGTGVGRAGRIGSTPHAMLKARLAEQAGTMKKNLLVDAREAILKHTKQADSVYSSVYAKTQPTKIFAQDEEDEEEDNK